jgi:hypothetical protein
MRRDDIRGFLTTRPFQPFRITLTDGRTYDVLHPELALVGRTFVAIGLARSGDPEGVADRMITVSLLHVMQIEPIESVSTPPGA